MFDETKPLSYSTHADVFFHREAELVARGLRCRELYAAIAGDPGIPRRYSPLATARILKLTERELRRHVATTDLKPVRGGKVEFFTAEAICDHLASLCAEQEVA